MKKLNNPAKIVENKLNKLEKKIETFKTENEDLKKRLQAIIDFRKSIGMDF